MMGPGAKSPPASVNGRRGWSNHAVESLPLFFLGVKVNDNFLTPAAMVVTPDLLVIAVVIVRARRQSPTPPAVVVFPDGREERL